MQILSPLTLAIVEQGRCKTTKCLYMQYQESDKSSKDIHIPISLFIDKAIWSQ